ncbi:phosphatidate cytidylyltransferase [Oribacterium sp. WCC10]|uniref:phosphatidate cytidylyltransferase n=1 Tax=Oribacterium sp. WCC10 TaxID=1855343 RepID=UPI0008ED004F|nr:phosphatidate cytidylyltransferase [Oribacterium sp. WCC10]SFG09334.1 phosphatidate cytidylyltransferase [Oribacterium sp. WCC10]
MTETDNLKKDHNEKKMSSFITRLISGIILVLCSVVIVPMGGPLLFLLTFFTSMIGLYELYRVFGIEKRSLGFIGYLTTISYYVLVWFNINDYFTIMIVLSLMALMAFYVITYPTYKISTVAKAFMCVCYAGIMMSYLYQTREMPDGAYLVWLIFLASWGADTCAYCVGMLFGKHKMTPILSPKKSVEGAFGGVIGAALLGFIYASIFKSRFTFIIDPAATCAIACGIGALISMVGDLTASGIKRDYSIKDYGTIIPGHGGIMDRFDSMIFTAPAVYFALTFLN